MLVNILRTFDHGYRRYYRGENPDVHETLARQWIADGWATPDLDGASDAPTEYLYRGSWAGRPAQAGAMDLALFYDIGNGVVPWFWDGTRWMPSCPVTVFQSVAITTGVQQTADQVLIAIPIPAGLLTGKVFHLAYTLGRDGTTDLYGTTSLRLGTTGGVGDSPFATVNTSGNWGGSRSMGVHNSSRAASNVLIEKLGTANAGASWVGSASGAVLNTPTGVPNLDTNATFLSITTTMAGATTRPQLGFVSLTVQA